MLDLLIDVARKKAPKQIKYQNKLWNFCEDMQDYVYEDHYLREDNYDFIYKPDFWNEEVEIIEEKEIEKIDSTANNTLFTIQCYIGMKEQAIDHNFTVIQDKINELVDEINKLKKEKNMEDQ